MRLSSRSCALAAVLACPLAAAPAASATVSLDRDCYLDGGADGRQPITVTADGLTPGEYYNVGFLAPTGAETGYAYGTADASGTVTMTMQSWYAGSATEARTHTATVVLRQSGSTTPIATLPARTSAVRFDVKGTKTSRSWKVVGLAALTGGRTYWAHYFRGSKRLGSMELGRAEGPCGVYSGTRPFIPSALRARNPKLLKITTSKTFRASDPWIGATIVRRRIS